LVGVGVIVAVGTDVGVGNETTDGMGVETKVVGVFEGKGDARGRGSGEKQPDIVRGKTARRQVSHRLLNIIFSFLGFD
jgi:hypothetical protein